MTVGQKAKQNLQTFVNQKKSDYFALLSAEIQRSAALGNKQMNVNFTVDVNSAANVRMDYSQYVTSSDVEQWCLANDLEYVDNKFFKTTIISWG